MKHPLYPPLLWKAFCMGKNLTLLTKQSCQPWKMVLSKRKKKIGKRDRWCSEGSFRCKDGSKRSWLTYSLDNGPLYCIPCLLYSDEVLRREGQQKNQGNSFVKAGFSNWKNQFKYVWMHGNSQSRINSKIDQVMF